MAAFDPLQDRRCELCGGSRSRGPIVSVGRTAIILPRLRVHQGRAWGLRERPGAPAPPPAAARWPRASPGRKPSARSGRSCARSEMRTAECDRHLLGQRGGSTRSPWQQFATPSARRTRSTSSLEYTDRGVAEQCSGRGLILQPDADRPLRAAARHQSAGHERDGALQRRPHIAADLKESSAAAEGGGGGSASRDGEDRGRAPAIRPGTDLFCWSR
jgi:hypothetical protein